MLDALKTAVCEANLALARSGLVTLTWGNVSGIDREKGRVVIKPSGVTYEDMRPARMVVVDLDGARVDGDLNPSSDTPTHVELYRAFPDIGGVTHTHSTYATAFAQAAREIPCLGTTHADVFNGAVPLTRPLRDLEIYKDYEKHTGRVIVERFAEIDPLDFPGVLVDDHGPFTWGPTPMQAVDTAIALEAFARMAALTFALDPEAAPVSDHILKKHFTRKHGPDAYYGQE